MGFASKPLIGLVILLLAGISAAWADDYDTYVTPKMQTFIDCVHTGEPVAAKSSDPAQTAADRVMIACVDKLAAVRVALISAPVSASQADADQAVDAMLADLRPKVIKTIGQLRGAN